MSTTYGLKNINLHVQQFHPKTNALISQYRLTNTSLLLEDDIDAPSPILMFSKQTPHMHQIPVKTSKFTFHTSFLHEGKACIKFTSPSNIQLLLSNVNDRESCIQLFRIMNECQSLKRTHSFAIFNDKENVSPGNEGRNMKRHMNETQFESIKKVKYK